MKSLVSMLLLGLVLSAPVYAAGQTLDEKQLKDVPNAVKLEDHLVAGGAPSDKGVQQLKEQGVQTVIDLRDPKEGTAEEKKKVEAAGLKYVNVPVSVANFSPANADELGKVLKDPSTGPALLHCATGQRAVATWALYKNRAEGVPGDQVLSDAKAKGLKKPELLSKLQSLLHK